MADTNKPDSSGVSLVDPTTSSVGADIQPSEQSVTEQPSGTFVISANPPSPAEASAKAGPMPAEILPSASEVPIEPGGAPIPEEPTPTPPQETIIIPAPPSSETQFVPQGLQPNGQDTPGIPPQPPPIPQGGGGGVFRMIFLLLLLLLLLGGGFLGIRYGVPFLQNNKEVTITYWGLWENDESVTPLISDFEKENPKIKVQYVRQNYRQYRERLSAAIDRGEGPDVFRFHATWIPMLKNEIQPVPVDVMSPSEFSSSYYKVAVNDLLAGSTIWGIPVMIDGLGLYINDDLFATAGVSPPATYEDLLSLVPKLTVKNGTDIVTSAIALGTTNNVEHFSDILALMILQNGGKLSDPTGKEGEEALQFYRKFSSPSDTLYTWNETMDNSIAAFANGRAAMILAPSWRAFDIKALKPERRFHIEPVPQLPGSTVTWASYWVEGVSAKSKYQKQAFTFLKYLTSKQGATKLYSESAKTRLFGEPYARVELGDTVRSDPFVGAYIKQAPTARSFPLASKTFDNGLNDQMIKYMEDAVGSVIKGTSPPQALETMATGFRQVLTTYGLVTNSAP